MPWFGNTPGRPLRAVPNHCQSEHEQTWAATPRPDVDAYGAFAADSYAQNAVGRLRPNQHTLRRRAKISP